jgi:hypothetical protein
MKKLFLLAAIFMMALPSNAQVTFEEDESSLQEENFDKIGVDKRKNVVSLGVTAGANYSSMSKYDPVDLGLKGGIGFQGGLVIAARFGKRTNGSDPGTGIFGIQMEPSYVQHSIGTNGDNIKLSYFEVPILLKFYVTPNLNIEVGPNICGSLSSSPDYIEEANTRIAIGDLKGFDFKVTAGVSYELKNGLYASLRYNLGTSDLAKNFPCKVSAASLTLGYKFNIFKF